MLHSLGIEQCFGGKQPKLCPFRRKVFFHLWKKVTKYFLVAFLTLRLMERGGQPPACKLEVEWLQSHQWNGTCQHPTGLITDICYNSLILLKTSPCKRSLSEHSYGRKVSLPYIAAAWGLFAKNLTRLPWINFITLIAFLIFLGCKDKWHIFLKLSYDAITLWYHKLRCFIFKVYS